ncbi:MAG TPA: arylsulfotransferase family protein [Chitinispirillaceae bacterium]|nr:arylsulfotransferase family protein [Chitinispirillaceae bacterium]
MPLKSAYPILLAGAVLICGAFAQQKTYDGYTFVFSGKNAYLYDMDKKAIKTWTVPNNIEGCADLLRDSSIIVPSKASGSGFGSLALPHGHFQIINWNGEVTWDYTYSSSSYTPHHDIEPVYRTNDPKEKPTFLIPCYTAWGDKIVELRPTGKTTAEVIWEWNASDHVCESGCSDKADLFDKSMGGKGSFNKTSDAMHVNNVSYNRALDQIILSCKGYNELIIIDHSTTTAQAKTSSGGKSGKGGRILYRWGSPSNYGMSDSKVFSGQHHCGWVPDTMPGTNQAIPDGGNFMAVDNGNKRVLEIKNPFKTGTYSRTSNKAFEPASFLWSFKPTSLAGNEGSIQKLPNGNYLVCTGGVSMGGFGGAAGGSIVYEIAPSGTSAGTVLWQIDGFGTSTEGYRYAYGYLNGKTTSVNSTNMTAANSLSLKIVTGIISGGLQISTDRIIDNAKLSLFSLSGKEILRNSAPVSGSTWNMPSPGAGMYFVKITSGEIVLTERISVQ